MSNYKWQPSGSALLPQLLCTNTTFLSWCCHDELLDEEIFSCQIGFGSVFVVPLQFGWRLLFMDVVKKFANLPLCWLPDSQLVARARPLFTIFTVFIPSARKTVDFLRVFAVTSCLPNVDTNCRSSQCNFVWGQYSEMKIAFIPSLVGEMHSVNVFFLD